MRDISISRPHALTHDQAVRKTNEVAAELAVQYGLVARWQGDVVHISGRGVTGRLRLTDDELHLDVELGFLVAFFRDSILAAIEAKLDRLLRADAPKAKRAPRKPSKGKLASTKPKKPLRGAKPG